MNEALTTNEAASKISALKNPPEQNKETAPEAQEDAAPKEQEEFANQEAEAEPVTQDAETEETEEDDTNETAEDEESDAEAQDDLSDDEETEGEDDPVFTVKIDGEEFEVTLEELISGYSRTGDYSKKMNELSKERKELETIKEEIKDFPAVQKRYNESAERFVRNAQLIDAALAQRFMPQPPSKELAETDPTAYIQQKENYQEALQFRKAIAHEVQQIEVAQQEEQAREVAKGREELLKLVPDMKSDSTRKKFQSYLNSHGFTNEQISKEANARLFEYAFKAMKYDEIMEKKEQLKTHKHKPKLVSTKKSPPNQKAIKQRKRTQHLDNHKSEKSLNSAAKAISALKRD